MTPVWRTSGRLAASGTPVLFEVRNQFGAETAVRLLASINRTILPKYIERFEPDTERTAIGDKANPSGAQDILADSINGRIHFIRCNDLVANEPALSAFAEKLQSVLDRLAGDAHACEARESKVCKPRNDALLPGRQCQLGAGRRQDIVHAEHDLTVSADRERIHRRNPRLFKPGPMQVIGHGVRRRDATQQLVHVANSRVMNHKKGIFPW